ncbi:unnamed protein product, partial [marine sediment metagenome]
MRIGRSPTRLISKVEIDADIAMATHILTGLGDGVEDDESARVDQIFEAIASSVAGEATDRAEAITAHEEADTGVHGVGASTVCSETEAAALIAATLELIDSASPSAAADVEFTELDGDLFLVFIYLYGSASTELNLRLNGVTTNDYSFRQFVNGTTIGTDTGTYRIGVGGISATELLVGCLFIAGKRVGANNNLTAGFSGGVITVTSRQ